MYWKGELNRGMPEWSNRKARGIAAVRDYSFEAQPFAVGSTRMNLQDVLWHDGKLLGIEWSLWKVIGWCGNAVFFSRFFVQWYATEKQKQVVVPAGFWWLSLIGSLLLLSYGLSKHDSVFIFAYAFTWIPYIRNLVIHYRNAQTKKKCGGCATVSPKTAQFCANCGTKLSTETPANQLA